MSNDKSDFEQWAEQRGLSTTKCDWYGDIYESEATLYAYMGWEARQKEINALKAKLEEFILCVGGTEEKYGLIELIDAYYYDSDVHEKAQRLIEETKLLIESKLMEN